MNEIASDKSNLSLFLLRYLFLLAFLCYVLTVYSSLSLYLSHSFFYSAATPDDVVSLDYTSDSAEYHNCSSDCSVGCHASIATLTEKQRTRTHTQSQSPTQTLSSICSTTSPSTASNDSDSLFGN